MAWCKMLGRPSRWTIRHQSATSQSSVSHQVSDYPIFNLHLAHALHADDLVAHVRQVGHVDGLAAQGHQHALKGGGGGVTSFPNNLNLPIDANVAARFITIIS